MSTPARPAAAHGWRIGSLAGTPVYLGRSWPIIAVLIVVLFGPNLSRPDRGASYGYLLAATLYDRLDRALGEEAVTDLAALLSVQAGYDPRAPLSNRQDPAQFAAADDIESAAQLYERPQHGHGSRPQ